MHQQRIAIAVAAGLCVLSAFLPWLEDVPWYGVMNGFQTGRGTSAIVLGAAVLLGMFAGNRTAPLTPGGMGLCRVAGGLAVLFAIYGIGAPAEVGAGGHPGTGPYFLLLVGVGIAVLPNLVRGDRGRADNP
ncbi:hypothetical protein [Actinophytocola sp.]|jgi:hypothetical protein|uniref:hypothetical protein n=1 Tax=Actinophytocola sp. TaxID=1872138 RepID=UPI002ED95CEB